MKAILTFNRMPRKCTTCPLYIEEFSVCPHIDSPSENGRPSDCPLKSLPRKKVREYDKHIFNDDDCSWTEWDYECGYNKCLEDIEG